MYSVISCRNHYGTMTVIFRGHLAEIMWRNHMKNNHLVHLLTLITDVFNVDTGVVDLDLPRDFFGTFPNSTRDEMINEIDEGDGDVHLQVNGFYIIKLHVIIFIHADVFIRCISHAHLFFVYYQFITLDW